MAVARRNASLTVPKDMAYQLAGLQRIDLATNFDAGAKRFWRRSNEWPRSLPARLATGPEQLQPESTLVSLQSAESHALPVLSPWRPTAAQLSRYALLRESDKRDPCPLFPLFLGLSSGCISRITILPTFMSSFREKKLRSILTANFLLEVFRLEQHGNWCVTGLVVTNSNS
jgi:hypothetical protein